MFNNQIETYDGIIVLAMLVFIGIIFASMFFGRIILWVYGKLNTTALTGKEALEKLIHSSSSLKIKEIDFLLKAVSFSYNTQTNTISLSKNVLNKANLGSIRIILMAFDNMEDIKANDSEKRWHYRGMVGMLLASIIVAIVTLLIVYLSPINDKKATPTIYWIPKFFVEILSILGIGLNSMIWIWWVKATQSNREKLIKNAKDILTTYEIVQMRRMLTIWMIMPFSTRIII